VAVYIDPRGRGYYFDSDGLPLLYKKFENFLNRNCVWWNLIARLCKLRFQPCVVSIAFIFCCVCVVVNQCVSLYRVFREMWLKMIVLLRSLRIFAEFVNKSPWHHVCRQVNFDRKTNLVSLNLALESESDPELAVVVCCSKYKFI